ncbi:812_t:CDS:2, partial [Entrophospora sp. SA101]
DKKFRESFVRLIYLHKNALDSYVKVDKEVKSLQFLTTKESKEEVQMEREEAEKALKTASI